MKKILITILATFLLSILAPFFSQSVYAACPDPDHAKTSQDQALSGLGTSGGDCSGSGVTNFISAIVNILSIVVGIAAIIVIILSGLKYITSGGDSGKIASAKNTLIYALIGLVVAALAQFLVHFVLTASTSSTCGSGQHLKPDGATCVKN